MCKFAHGNRFTRSGIAVGIAEIPRPLKLLAVITVRHVFEGQDPYFETGLLCYLMSGAEHRVLGTMHCEV